MSQTVHDTIHQASAAASRRHFSANYVLLHAGIAVLSVGLALIAMFVLSNWAEASEVHHGLQHVLLLTAGMGIGASLVNLFKRGK